MVKLGTIVTEGPPVGSGVTWKVGLEDGFDEGSRDGAYEGLFDGSVVGIKDGATEGELVGKGPSLGDRV